MNVRDYARRLEFKVNRSIRIPVDGMRMLLV